MAINLIKGEQSETAPLPNFLDRYLKFKNEVISTINSLIAEGEEITAEQIDMEIPITAFGWDSFDNYSFQSVRRGFVRVKQSVKPFKMDDVEIADLCDLLDELIKYKKGGGNG